MLTTHIFLDGHGMEFSSYYEDAYSVILIYCRFLSKSNYEPPFYLQEFKTSPLSPNLLLTPEVFALAAAAASHEASLRAECGVK